MKKAAFMALLKTDPTNAERDLTTPAAQEELLNGAFTSSDAAHVAHALGVLARAQGMTKVALEVNVAREALYRSLSENGNPRLTTVLSVMKTLGLTLRVKVNRKSDPVRLVSDHVGQGYEPLK